MFKSSEKLRAEAAQRSLDRVASSWRTARTTWFDGTPESIEARLAETNRVLTVARAGFSPAHLGLAVEAENARRELLAAKHRLLTDFLDDGARVAGYHDADPEAPWRNTMADEPYASLAETPEFGDLPVDGGYPGRHRLHENDHGMWEDQLMEDGGPGAPQNGPGRHRALEARAPEENENFEEGANYADYYGKCTRCKSDNIDSTSTSGEYDCYDCGATFHPKVRKLKSSVHTAGEYDEGIDNLSRYLGDRLLNPQQYVRTYSDEDGPGLPGGLPMELRKHLKHPDPEQGAYNAGYAASGGTGDGKGSPYMNHEDPWDAASTDWYRAGGQHGDAFNDGWVDYASEIPHRYNNAPEHAGHPEGYFKGAGLYTAGQDY